ncbi:MAG: YegS/Rv2252/BmrU family lipid kinase [Firmicutes bacterium]|nr:YegS/Rv2252/BmrU family lipid kinase [Bacillota bacterium]
MKHVFIVNRISGKGSAIKLIPIIEEAAKNLDYEIIVTDYPHHASEITSKYSNTKETVIYAVGGDGTILEILDAINEDTPIGIIPSGSGNDFYRQFNDKITDYKKLITDTINAKPIEIDYAYANDMRFLNTTSVGIDSDVNYDASKMIRKTLITKGPAYILSIIKNVIIPRAKHLKIIIDGKVYEDDFMLANIMNGKYYGNGVMASPYSDIRDGYLNIVFAKKYPVLTIYKLLAKYLKGEHVNDKHFTFLKAKNITIDSSEPFSVQSDGENYKTNHLDIHIKEKGLLLKVPYSL